MAQEIAADADQYIPLSQVPRLPFLPRRRRGRKLHTSTVYRWSDPGLHGVRLRFVKCGGVRCTTVSWLKEFFRALAAADAESDLSSQSPPTPSQSNHVDVELQLDALGVKDKGISTNKVGRNDNQR